MLHFSHMGSAMNGLGLHEMRSALAGAVLSLAAALPATAQVIEIGPDGVTAVSGPSVVTPEGVVPIRTERRMPVSSKHAAAAPLLENAGEAADLSPRLLEAIAYVE